MPRIAKTRDPHASEDEAPAFNPSYETDWVCLDWVCATVFAVLSSSMFPGLLWCPRCGGSLVELPGWECTPPADEFAG